MRRFAHALRPIAAVLLAVGALIACGDGDSAPRVPPAGGEDSDPEIDRFINHTLPQGPGGTVVAARAGEIVTCTGVGLADHENKVQANCDTVYDIMSMTKQFTAAGILKLEMMGGVRVTDSIDKYIGPVPDDKRGITIHHLLTHTAGLVDGIGGDYESLLRDEMLDRALKSKLRSRPGTEYFYSNLGYSVLAAIIEKVSGLGYEEFLAENLFGPAGMTQTGYVLPDWSRDRVAVEYDERGKPMGRPFDHPWTDDGPYWNLRGNGGLLSTARDMFRWHLALDGDVILDQSAKDKLFKPHVLEEKGGDTYYGYGWVVLSTKEGRTVWHNGGNGWSYGEIARSLRDGVMVFWISNHAYKKGKWNLEELDGKFTLGIADRVLR